MTNIDFGSLLFTFEGRINRAKYWLAFALYMAVMFVAVGLLFTMDRGMVVFILVALLYLATIVSSAAVGIKRLHDCDKSGWWLLLFYLAPGFLGGAANYTVAGGAMLLSLVSVAISLWGIVQLGFLRGTAGPNRFGPNPLAAGP